MKVKELLSDESKWCKGILAKSYDGIVVSVLSESACQWCLSGAVYKCCWENKIIIGKEYDFVQEELKIFNKINEELKNKADSIEDWNDSPNRTFQDVKDLVNKLDI